MSRVCEISGRKTSFGGARKHQRGSSGGGGVWRYKAQRTQKIRKPNLVTKKIKDLSDGTVQTMKISAKTLKRIKKFGRIQNYTLAE